MMLRITNWTDMVRHQHGLFLLIGPLHCLPGEPTFQGTASLVRCHKNFHYTWFQLSIHCHPFHLLHLLALPLQRPTAEAGERQVPAFSRTGVAQLKEALNGVTRWEIVLRVPETMTDPRVERKPCGYLYFVVSRFVCLFILKLEPQEEVVSQDTLGANTQQQRHGVLGRSKVDQAVGANFSENRFIIYIFNVWIGRVGRIKYNTTIESCVVSFFSNHF